MSTENNINQIIPTLLEAMQAETVNTSKELYAYYLTLTPAEIDVVDNVLAYLMRGRFVTLLAKCGIDSAGELPANEGR